MGTLEEELAFRATRGERPITVQHLNELLRRLGYRLDRDMDCRCMSRWMTGPRAGESYPCITTSIKEIDTGVSAFHFEKARRDKNFRALQDMRGSGRYFAVTRGFILEI
jgi:hypothetical protein